MEVRAGDTVARALQLDVDPDDGPARSFIPSPDVPSQGAARRHLLAAGCRPVPAGVTSGGVYSQDPIGLIFHIVEQT